MSLILDDLYAYLCANGFGPSTAWPVYEGFIPNDTDQVVALFQTGGYPADTLGRENERLTFQVRVRAKRLSYAQCYGTWLAIFNLLQDAQQTSGSPQFLVGWYLCQAIHYGPLMFNDDLGRTNMTMNFRIVKAAEGTT